jgi:23S rRNA (pseudouridine1915-N3)-methyltransferase
LVFLFVSGDEDFADEAALLYTEKCSRICSAVVARIKSPKLGREQARQKVLEEAKLIRRFLRPDDRLFVFDQEGRATTSEQFSEILSSSMAQRGRTVLLVGGAFGLESEIRERASRVLSLSPWIMSHEVAQVVVLEQSYRALTIQLGLPYHNPSRPD